MTNILLVEDESGIRLLMRNILESAGYQVCEAEEGFQALGLLLQGQPIDLVVTDIRMPRMDGYELAAHMTALGLKVPIVFVTGYIDELDAAALPGPVLPKPFMPEQLVASVTQVCPV
jgi:two-component system, cell cycle sensor histidine kinase and response regulator CckA